MFTHTANSHSNDEGEISGIAAPRPAYYRDLNGILKKLRVKVAKFDESNVKDWIYKINQFFYLHQIEDCIRLTVVTFHLEGVSTKWFQLMEKSEITQTGHVAQFRSEFKELMIKVAGVSKHLFLNFFVWDLKMEICKELLLSKSVDLADVMAKAQLFEDRNDDLVVHAKGDGF
uniref:Retrotransposon gag domain-containing protein n=1 Tax=Cannabis sativa TaxID=3483 RepID=A0A803NN51_CANSA